MPLAGTIGYAHRRNAHTHTGVNHGMLANRMEEVGPWVLPALPPRQPTGYAAAHL